MAQLWRVVDGGLVESVTRLPIILVPIKSEDDKNGQQSWTYSVHFLQTQTEGNTEVEASTNNPAKQIKSEPDGGDCGEPELTSNPDSTSHLQPSSDRKALTSSETDNLCLKKDSGEKGWDNRGHGSGVNINVECDTAKESLRSSDCGGEFHRQQSLKRWKKTYGCGVCGKIFGQRTNLRMHTRIHTGDKRFSCDECGFRFIRNSHLKRHIRIHTGEKPFSCDKCGQRFSRKDQMKSHIGCKPSSCDKSGQT